MAASRLLRNETVSNLITWTKQLKFPEKLKGGRLERYALYWKNMYIDYKEAIGDAAQDARQHPRRSIILFSSLGFLFASSFFNPDERHFEDCIVRYGNKFVMLPNCIRSKRSEQHMLTLNRYQKQGQLRFLSLGFMTLLWADDYDPNCGLYASQCEYLKPRYVTFHGRILDVGFLNRWWVLESKMKDYDVNEIVWTGKEDGRQENV